MREQAKNLRRSRGQSPLLVLGSLALVTAILYAARTVFIPLALAILFTFILAPIVTVLRRRGVGRTGSVVLTVTLSFVLLGGIGAALFIQLRGLADDLPAYRQNISRKIADLRLASRGGPLEKAQETVQAVIQDVNQQFGGVTTNTPAVPVVVSNSSTASSLTAVILPLLEPLATAGLVVVLVIFMLLRREDLRDRLLRLVGRGHLATTTKAIDEAGKRLSRYLLRQFLLNAGFGVALGTGVFLIGLPYAFFWGALAGVARFVPYAGPSFAALAPVVMSLAVFDGWNQPLMVIGLILILELVQNTVVEPLVYGQGMGVSEVALLVMIAFWTWLWGPIGLVLAAPLTVCLVVASRDVRELEFLSLLLSSDPALPPSHVFYQRLVAKDADEAQQIVDEKLAKQGLAEVYDQLLLPALAACRHDYQQGRLTEADQTFAYQTIRQMIEETGGAMVQVTSKNPPPTAVDHLQGNPGPQPLAVLGQPAHDEADELSLLMLAELMRAANCPMRVLSSHLLSAEALAEVTEAPPSVLCIGSLAGGSLFAARQFCKRVCARHPESTVVLARWMAQDLEPGRKHMNGLAVEVAGTMAEIKNYLIQLARTRSGPEASSGQTRSSPTEPAVSIAPTGAGVAANHSHSEHRR